LNTDPDAILQHHDNEPVIFKGISRRQTVQIRITECSDLERRISIFPGADQASELQTNLSRASSIILKQREIYDELGGMQGAWQDSRTSQTQRTRG
jgi:hypothetical protein